MKKVDRYICEVCGTEYADKAQCGRCERNHREAKRILCPNRYAMGTES